MYLASGCFWGREFHLRGLPGVVSTRTGFAGGHLPAPTYQQVCTKTTGHAEVVEVVYNPVLLSTTALLTEFFTLHDATIDRSGPDGSGQYRSAIFYRIDNSGAEELLTTAQSVIQRLLTADIKVSTQIAPITAFYPADSRHQQYCSARGMSPKKRDSARIREILTSA